MMRAVRVRAINLQPGDVIGGQRIKAVHRHVRRLRGAGVTHKAAMYGVLIVTPNPNGYKLDTIQLTGDTFVNVRRPKYNMKYAKKTT